MPLKAVAAVAAPTRDPAWLGRVAWLSLGAVLLWPLAVATEFRPWVLVDPDLPLKDRFLGIYTTNPAVPWPARRVALTEGRIGTVTERAITYPKRKD